MGVVEAFEGEARVLSEAVGRLSRSDLEIGTRCGSWDIRTLVAHVVNGLERAVGMVAEPVDLPPDRDRLVYYTSELRSDPSRSVERERATVAAAARFETGDELTDAIAASADSIISGLDRIGPTAVVATHWGPVMRIDDYLLTRVVELAVHGIDVSDALGVPAWTTPRASASIADLVSSLIGLNVSVDLPWSDADLVRIGTGRFDGDPSEVQGLGPLADYLPVIS